MTEKIQFQLKRWFHKKFSRAQRFASTGGWTVAHGSAMNHYSMHHYFDLSVEEQKRVDDISRTIYRPCCSNSAHFPDCNHGMAMLGLLELLASQGAVEAEMTKVAHLVNSYWFPRLRDGSPKLQGGCSV